MDWNLIVLVLILLQLMWIGSQLGTTTETKDATESLKEIREELQWFKDDTFAHHLLSEIQGKCGTLETTIETIKTMNASLGNEMSKLQKQLRWFDDDSGVAHLLKTLDAINRSLDSIDDRLSTSNASLDDLQHMAVSLERIQDNTSR